MSNTLIIARREISSFFNSPMAYIVVSALLLISGYLYFSSIFLIGTASLRSFFSLAPLLLVVFVPAVSMRLISEELHSGTLELLTTMPVRDTEVIAGKALAGFSVMGAGLLMTLAYPMSIATIGDLDWGPVIGGYVGLLLCTAALIGIGIMASSWSRNQITAFILALMIGLAFWLFDKITFFVPAGLGRILEYLSIDFHFRNIARGVIDTRDLLYYFSLLLISLVIAVLSLGRRHA
jgi:ABC-2 type transport system permease protein